MAACPQLGDPTGTAAVCFPLCSLNHSILMYPEGSAPCAGTEPWGFAGLRCVIPVMFFHPMPSINL